MRVWVNIKPLRLTTKVKKGDVIARDPFWAEQVFRADQKESDHYRGYVIDGAAGCMWGQMHKSRPGMRLWRAEHLREPVKMNPIYSEPLQLP